MAGGCGRGVCLRHLRRVLRSFLRCGRCLGNRRRGFFRRRRFGLTGALGAKGLHNVRIRFDVGAADQINAVGDCGKNTGCNDVPVIVIKAPERLGNRLGLAREIDDQRRVPRNFAKDRHLARENGRGNKVQRNAPHLFAESRHFAGGDGERCLGRHVP